MKELTNEGARKAFEQVYKYTGQADANGRTAVYAMLALVHELDELNSILDEIRAEGIPPQVIDMDNFGLE